MTVHDDDDDVMKQEVGRGVCVCVTFLEASGWMACLMTRGLMTQSVQEFLPRHLTSADTDCSNC